MAFETFQKQRTPMPDEAAVTIQRRGNMSLNARAFADLGEPKAVELLYDRDEMLIGIRKTDPTGENAYVVRAVSKGSSSYLVSGMAFTAYYGIHTEIAHRWIASFRDDMLVIDLKQPGTVVTSNRKKAEERERSLFPS
jgi:hypothetical protein